MIAGWAAGPASAIAGGTVDDLFSERERGLAMALCTIMPFIGTYTQSLFVSVLTKYDLIRSHRWCVYLLCYLMFFMFIDFVGPIAGGYIVESVGVKYVFIVASASCGVAALVCIPFLRETYAPVIRSGLAATSSDPEKVIDTPVPKSESIWHVLWLNLSRPVLLLTRSFICFILSLYIAM
jgi:hypothetical protein